MSPAKIRWAVARGLGLNWKSVKLEKWFEAGETWFEAPPGPNPLWGTCNKRDKNVLHPLLTNSSLEQKPPCRPVSWTALVWKQPATSSILLNAVFQSHLRQIPRSSLARSDSLPESIRMSVSWRPHWCSPFTIAIVSTEEYTICHRCHCCHHFQVWYSMLSHLIHCYSSLF